MFRPNTWKSPTSDSGQKIKLKNSVVDTAYLGNMAGLFPDYCNKVNVAIKWVMNILVSSAWWLDGKESICQCRRCKRCGFNSWIWKISWNRKMVTHSSISCLKNSKDRGAWRAIVHRVAKSWTWLSIHTHTQAHKSLYHTLDCKLCSNITLKKKKLLKFRNTLLLFAKCCS